MLALAVVNLMSEESHSNVKFSSLKVKAILEPEFTVIIESPIIIVLAFMLLVLKLLTVKGISFRSRVPLNR